VDCVFCTTVSKSSVLFQCLFSLLAVSQRLAFRHGQSSKQITPSAPYRFSNVVSQSNVFQ